MWRTTTDRFFTMCLVWLNSVFTKQLLRGRSRVCTDIHGKQWQSTPQNHTELNVKASVFSKDTPVSKLKLRSVFAFSDNVHTRANTYQKGILHDACISLNTSYQNKIWHFVCVNVTANGMWVAAFANTRFGLKSIEISPLVLVGFVPLSEPAMPDHILNKEYLDEITVWKFRSYSCMSCTTVSL